MSDRNAIRRDNQIQRWKVLFAVMIAFFCLALLVTKQKVDSIADVALSNPLPIRATPPPAPSIAVALPLAGGAQAPVLRPPGQAAPDFVPQQAPPSLSYLNRRAALRAFEDFLQVTAIRMEAPFVFDKFDFDHSGPRRLVFRGYSHAGDEFTLIVDQNRDPVALVRSFLEENGYATADAKPESFDGLPYFTLFSEGRTTIVRSGVLGDDGIFLVSWRSERAPAGAELKKLNPIPR